MAKESQLYELSMLINPDIPEQEALGVIDSVCSHIEKKNAIIERRLEPKLRELAYAIQKRSRAYVTSLQFMATPDSIAIINAETGKTEHIVRHLLVAWKRESAPRPVIRRAPAPLIPTPTEKSASSVSLEPAETPQKVDEQELDKKLDEILGKNTPPQAA